MATQIQVLVDGVDRTSLIDWRSIKINKKLTSQVDTASFRYAKALGSWVPSENEEVIIKFDSGNGDGLQKVFAGYSIGVVDDIDEGGDRNYVVTCKDYNYLLDRRLVVSSFTNKTPKQIIDALIAEYSPSMGITTTNVDTFPTIQQIDFVYVPIRVALQRIAEVTYKDWYIDEDKDIHLFDREDNLAPFDASEANKNIINGSLVVSDDLSNLKNRIVVVGGEFDGSTQVDPFFGSLVGASLRDSFVLTYKFRFSGMSITVNGTPQTIGIEGLADETAVDVVGNQEYRSIRFTAGNVPADGDEIVVTYTPILPLIIAREDTNSISDYGTWEVQIVNPDIKSLQSAKDLADAQLDVYSRPIKKVNFQTYSHGLDSGQLLHIESSKADLNDDLIIYELVMKTFAPDVFWYEVKCTSAREQGIMEILQRLLLETDFGTNLTAIKVESSVDNILISESVVVSSGGDYDTSDTIEVEEDVITSNTIKTWVWAYYAPTDNNDSKRPLYMDVDSKLA